jgi:hypothetical protein
MDPTKKITIHAEQADYLEYKVIQPLRKVEPNERVCDASHEELKKQTELHTAILNEAFLRAHGNWHVPKKIYTKCERCKKPKHRCRDQEFKLCFRCNKIINLH